MIGQKLEKPIESLHDLNLWSDQLIFLTSTKFIIYLKAVVNFLKIMKFLMIVEHNVMEDEERFLGNPILSSIWGRIWSNSLMIVNTNGSSCPDNKIPHFFSDFKTNDCRLSLCK